MLVPDLEFAEDTSLSGFQRLQQKLSPELAIFQGAIRHASCMWFAKFRTYKILLQNCAGIKKKS
jgi:hypothetical protein